MRTSCQWPVTSSQFGENSSSRLFVSCNLPVGSGIRSRVCIAVSRALSSPGGRGTQYREYSGGDHRDFNRVRIARSLSLLLLQKAIEKASIDFRRAKVRIAEDAAEQ